LVKKLDRVNIATSS